MSFSWQYSRICIHVQAYRQSHTTKSRFNIQVLIIKNLSIKRAIAIYVYDYVNLLNCVGFHCCSKNYLKKKTNKKKYMYICT